MDFLKRIRQLQSENALEHIAFQTLAPARNGASKFRLRLSLLSSSVRRHSRQRLTLAGGHGFALPAERLAHFMSKAL
ncbi:hypothetical protein [Desulfovibrio sp. ZJ200]|uniref:hypothetical protein n=1 Tax=Desulfovibrio sp. ZJ200 TaxID=2709792 RepID=UPI00197EF232|nr:hypothetical protein [Desulfovibrio sp. ZJ200]